MKVGDAIKPEVLAVAPKGARVAGVAVNVELIQRRWVVARQQVGGGHRTSSTIEDKVVASCAVTTTAGKAPVSCSLQPSGVGFYVVRASAKDRRGNALASCERAVRDR